MIKKEDLQHAIICKRKDTVLEVSKILRDTLSKHLYVVDDNFKPIGVISTIDINNRVIAEDKNPSEVLADEIKINDLEVVDIEVEYEEAFQKLIKIGTNSLPVVKDEKIIGLITIYKILSLKEKGRK